MDCQVKSLKTALMRLFPGNDAAWVAGAVGYAASA
jgi:hypothetical protein